MKGRPYAAGLLIWIGVATTPLSAVGVTLDFEGLSSMSNSPGDPIPQSARLSDTFLSSGVRFTSGSPFVAVVNLGNGHATSGVNGIGGSTTGGLLTYSASFPIVATFIDPHNLASPGVTDFVSVRGDLSGDPPDNVTLNAFNVDGNLIGSVTLTDVGGETLSISKAGIHSVQFIGTGNVALDDFTFDPVVGVRTSAPLLSRATLLILAVLLGGAGVWRARRLARR